MTRARRRWLCLGFGAALSLVGGRALQALWMLAALGFLALVALSIRAGRRRSYREFVEKPGAIVDTFKKPAEVDHRWDAIL